MNIRRGSYQHWVTHYMGKMNSRRLVRSFFDQSAGLLNAVAKVLASTSHVDHLRHLHANFLKSNGRLGKALKLKIGARD